MQVWITLAETSQGRLVVDRSSLLRKSYKLKSERHVKSTLHHLYEPFIRTMH